jgi:hypothetical protein
VTLDYLLESGQTRKYIETYFSLIFLQVFKIKHGFFGGGEGEGRGGGGEGKVLSSKTTVSEIECTSNTA